MLAEGPNSNLWTCSQHDRSCEVGYAATENHVQNCIQLVNARVMAMARVVHYFDSPVKLHWSDCGKKK